MAQQLVERKDVKVERTWDLTEIFSTQAEFEKAKEELLKKVSGFEEDYDRPEEALTVNALLSALKEYEAIRQLMGWIGQYGRLPSNVDIANSEYTDLSRSTSNFLAQIQAKLSFFTSLLTAQSEETLNEILTSEEKYDPFIRKIKKQKEHQLDPAVEKTLAELSPTLQSPLQLFEQARSADMDFGSFTVDGTEHPLSFVLYEEYYAYHPDTKVRRAAFEKFSSVLEQYKNVIATAYYTQVQKEKTLASLRGYDSIFDYLLEDQEVDQELYHRQIDKLMNDFSLVMRKYVTHLKQINGLDKVTFADLKLDLDPEFSPTITIEESEKMVFTALKPLGKNYLESIGNAFSDRWVDFPQNKGKRSGAFCSTAYGKHPYILVSWTDQLADAYTLFHELGHAGQGILSNENQSILGARPSLYLIEAPSTFNELLLTDHLKSTSEDPRMERSVLSKMISKTYFHNFVTHLLEAAYQREVYRLVDEGKGFDAKKLSDIKRSVLEKFWGEAVEINPGAELTWMRQIHYYMGLYSYTYSAGLTIATQAFLKVKEEGEPAMEKWIEFLSLGDKYEPIEAAAVAGVDITTDKPLNDTIQYLDETVDRIIELSKQIKE
ncbi:oligoendopeptidase F [Lacticigenium naphthae]|uniref:oligoendopeptidase F n=1 Tax=Lacticigenium naphthae TaxID=515351 RepID=UPI000429F81E|nr:oligoendopeptidase F [Lacticigenium naphthae]